MTGKPKAVNVNMIRDNLDCIPEIALPAPYAFRGYGKGDEAAWFRIWSEADAEYRGAGPETFRRDFGTDEGLIEARQLFIVDAGGEAVGTASAWFKDDHFGKPYGLVHWVAIVPKAQGKGLAKPLVARVLALLAGLGHQQALLTTQPYRLKAISVYLALGFLPELRTDDDRRAWRGVREALGASVLDSLDLS